MSPGAALHAATGAAAELIGASDRIGTVAAGRVADLVAMPGDPLSDPGLFDKVAFVMKGGVVYRRDGLPTAPSAQ